VLADGTAGPALSVGDSVANATLFYRSTFNFGDTSGMTTVGSDAFSYRLRDTGGELSPTSARFFVTIMSGLDAMDGNSVVLEEIATVIELRGINQRVEPGGARRYTSSEQVAAAVVVVVVVAVAVSSSSSCSNRSSSSGSGNRR